MRHRVLIILLSIFLWACEGYTTFRSSVPTYPVGLDLNLQQACLVHFTTSNTGAHLEFTRTHYPEGLTRIASDALGYGGILVYVTWDERYAAWDMCCPNCLSPDDPVEVDGMFATCPNCGEQYDLSYGYGTPSRGIAKEALRRYTCVVGNHKLRITN